MPCLLKQQQPVTRYSTTSTLACINVILKSLTYCRLSASLITAPANGKHRELQGPIKLEIKSTLSLIVSTRGYATSLELKLCCVDWSQPKPGVNLHYNANNAHNGISIHTKRRFHLECFLEFQIKAEDGMRRPAITQALACRNVWMPATQGQTSMKLRNWMPPRPTQ